MTGHAITRCLPLYGVWQTVPRAPLREGQVHCVVCHRAFDRAKAVYVASSPLFIISRRESLLTRMLPVGTDCMPLHPAVGRFIWTRNRLVGWVPLGEWAVQDNPFTTDKEPLHA